MQVGCVRKAAVAGKDLQNISPNRTTNNSQSRGRDKVVVVVACVPYGRTFRCTRT